MLFQTFTSIWFIYSYREGEEGRNKGRAALMYERNIYPLPLTCAPARDWASNPGMCPDRESNQWPFALQDDAQLSHPGQGSNLNYQKNSLKWEVESYISKCVCNLGGSFYVSFSFSKQSAFKLGLSYLQ